MQQFILQKINDGVDMTAKDVVYIGRGLKLSPVSSREVVFQTLVSNPDSKIFTSINRLIENIEKEEPFDELPDEVKPSLSRLSYILEKPENSVDRHILSPITAVLAKYVDLKAEHEKSKRHTYRAYLITIVSFLVGSISFYYTLNTPSASDIRQTMEQVLTERALREQSD